MVMVVIFIPLGRVLRCASVRIVTVRLTDALIPGVRHSPTHTCCSIPEDMVQKDPALAALETLVKNKQVNMNGKLFLFRSTKQTALAVKRRPTTSWLFKATKEGNKITQAKRFLCFLSH